MPRSFSQTLMKTPFHRLSARRLLAGSLFLGLLSLSALRADDAPYAVLVSPENSFDFTILKNGKPILNSNMMGWGPHWAWSGAPTSHDLGTSGTLAIKGTFRMGAAPNQSLGVELNATAGAGNTVNYQYKLSASVDTPLTMLATNIQIPKSEGPSSGTITVTANGQDVSVPLPVQMSYDLSKVSKAVFHLPTGDITAQFDPPVTFGREADSLRVKLAADVMTTGETSTTITWSFPEAVAFLSSPEDLAKYAVTVPQADWFPFAPKLEGPSVFGMEDWLDAPAGKHGGVRMDKDQFKFEDGTPVQFWGTNLTFGDCAPPKKVADAFVAKFCPVRREFRPAAQVYRRRLVGDG